jgi:hypothetical protein
LSLKKLAGLFREYTPGTFIGGAYFPDCTCRGIQVPTRGGGISGTWGCQECMNVACTVDAETNDLSAGIDAVGEQQIQRGVSRNESVEVSHHAILPEECARIPVLVERCADRIACVVNAEPSAVNISIRRNGTS